MSDSERLAIVPTPVMPLVSPEEAAKRWALFEQLKAKLLSEEDYQTIAGKRYIKRSGFRKIAVYFGISDRIVKEERTDREDSSFSVRIEVEAIAPNGRSCVGIGACDSRERKFAHLEHDVYATAHTRAKSRAISDLVAGGAVSAEEITQSDVDTTQNEASIPASATSESNQPNVPIVKEIIEEPDLRQFPLTDGLKSLGMFNVLNDEISIVPERTFKVEGSTIMSFLVPRVLEPMAKKRELTYTVAKSETGELEYVLIKGKIDDDLIRDLQAPSRWTFLKALEKEQTPKENIN